MYIEFYLINNKSVVNASHSKLTVILGIAVPSLYLVVLRFSDIQTRVLIVTTGYYECRGTKIFSEPESYHGAGF
jgi:hypothetical protein